MEDVEELQRKLALSPGVVRPAMPEAVAAAAPAKVLRVPVLEQGDGTHVLFHPI